MLLVFDLDGTLIDSRLDLAESVNETLGTFGAAPLGVDEIAAMVGDGARVLVERAIAAAGLVLDESVALDRFLAIYDRRLLVHTRPYPGLEEAVRQAAAAAPLAVLTNKPERATRRLLDAFALTPYFRAIVGGDSGMPRKPDPAGLLSLVAAVGTTPGRTLMVGDSMVDVETARRAGAVVCLALYGFGRGRDGVTLTGHDLVARTPQDVPRALAAFIERHGQKIN